MRRIAGAAGRIDTRSSTQEAIVTEVMSSERGTARLTPSETPAIERRPAEVLRRPPDASPRHRCPYCFGKIHVDARKCRHCGEWVVPTTRGASSAVLRAFGWLWAGASMLGAAGLWHVATLWRARQLLGVDDGNLPPPAVVNALLFGGVALIAIQGLVGGLGLVVFSALAPRRPR